MPCVKDNNRYQLAVKAKARADDIMSVSSKRTSASSGAPLSEERNGKTKSSSATASRRSVNYCLSNINAESDPSPYASTRERTSSIEQKKQGIATASKSSTSKSKSRTEALLSRRVTGSATSVRTQTSITTRPPTGKGPRRSTSSDKVQVGSENGYVAGQPHHEDQAIYRTGGARPKREVSSASSASSCSSSEGDERGPKVSPSSQKPSSRKSGTMDENGIKIGSPQWKSSPYSKSKTPPSVRRKSSQPSSENNSRFQRQSSLRSSQNGKPQQSSKKPATRTLSNSSLDNGSLAHATSPAESESTRRKLRNGSTKSSSEDSISDSEWKTKSALSRTPSTQRKVCMEIVMEKKIISKTNVTVTTGKAEGSVGKSPSKQSLSSPTDENANSTRTSPTKLKCTTTASVLGTHTGARMKVRPSANSTDHKANGAYSLDRPRIVSAPTIKRTDQSLPSVTPSGPIRAKSGSVRSSDMKQNLKSPDGSRVMMKIFPNRSRARARSVEPVARNVSVSATTTIDSATGPGPGPVPVQVPEGAVVNTRMISNRRSQSVERRSNKDSFVASRRQVWEEKSSQSPADSKKGSVTSPEKKFQRSGLGRRSLIDERKMMLFGGSSASGTRGQAKISESMKKPAIPAKPDNIASKRPSNTDHKGEIELYINEELPAPVVVAPVDTSSADTAKPAVLQENVQKIQPNAINLMPKLQPSTDEVDSTKRYSPSKVKFTFENKIIYIFFFLFKIY